MTYDEQLAVLSAHPLFRGISPDALSDCFSGTVGRTREFLPEEVIFPDGNGPPSLGILLSGKATVSPPDRGNNVLLRMLRAGDSFGIANLFCNEPFVSVIRAAENCVCLFLPEAAVRRLLDTDPAFRENYIAFLAGRIRFLNRKIGYLTAGGAERRLAVYLAGLGEGEIRLAEPISSLSDLLNLGRASLYRAFDRLEADGWLIRKGRKLRLTDPAGMLDAYR